MIMDSSSQRSKKRAVPWSRCKALVVQLAVCFVGGALAPLATTGGLSADGIRASFLPYRYVQRVPPPPAVPDIGLLLIVTVIAPDDDDDASQAAALTRLGHALRLVPPPLIWIVVTAESNRTDAKAVQALRGTGVMFRHLKFAAAAENGTTGGGGDEADQQRNVALSHIERHRLAGVVHFAAASAVYDLRFFQELRQTRGFAAWPTATVATTGQTVTVQGPTCSSSQITGWFFSKDSDTNATTPLAAAQDTGAAHNISTSPLPAISISGIGFRSSILRDSERFITRNDSSSEGETQDFIGLVRQVAAGHGDKRKAIPSDCSESRIMLWHLDMPRYTPQVEEGETPRNQSNLLKRDGEDLMT